MGLFLFNDIPLPGFNTHYGADLLPGLSDQAPLITEVNPRHRNLSGIGVVGASYIFIVVRLLCLTSAIKFKALYYLSYHKPLTQNGTHHPAR